MKKRIIGIVIMTGLFLLVSCGPKNTVEPLLTPERATTPTPIVVPTCTPTASLTPNPALKPTVPPTATPTLLPEVTSTPVPTEAPTNTPTPTPTVTPTPTEAPTNTPTPTLTPVPTETQVPTPTSTPEPTVTVAPSPEPTVTPTPSLTPTPIATPTPTVNPEPMVTYGWQKTISIDEKYQIVFPELFKESDVTKTDRELEIEYTCKEEAEIVFRTTYRMQLTLQEAVDEVLTAGGIIWAEFPEAERFIYLYQIGSTLYRGILVEEQYPQTLLGASFGEEEVITGVMQNVFSYPAENREKYETEQYEYYVVENREE